MKNPLLPIYTAFVFFFLCQDAYMPLLYIYFFYSSGTLTNIEFYISPYQVLEAELNPGKARKAEISNMITFSAVSVSLSKVHQ